MKLHILGSSSSGNSYILQGETCTLLIEAGMPLKEVKKELNFDLSNIAGILISHRHGDHFKYVKDFIKAGVIVCASVDTLNACKFHSHNFRVLQAKQKYNIGSFIVMPFEVKHDVECFGFLLNHPEMGLTLFCTDTMYLPYKFPGLNNLILEANYSEDIINERIANGDNTQLLKNISITNHMSFNTCKEILRVNDLKDVINIVLIHLSDGNSDAKLFKSEIEVLTCKQVHIAEPGLVIDFNKEAF